SQRLCGKVQRRAAATVPKPRRRGSDSHRERVAGESEAAGMSNTRAGIISCRRGVLLVTPDFSSALSLVRRTYAGLAPSVRAHAVGRFLTCPFLRVLAAVPPGARLLDLGAGHGTFARLAVEPDARKVLATYRHPRVHFVTGYADAVAGAFGAVSLLDVLYRIPLAGWDPLLRHAFDRLEPGGLLLLKEIDH